jgi:hypothetical protein
MKEWQKEHLFLHHWLKPHTYNNVWEKLMK